MTAGDRLAEILPFENYELVVRVIPTSNPKSPLRNLEPGTLVLLKGTRTKDGRVRDRTTIAAHAMASPTGDSTVTQLRLEAPLEAGVMIESVEYSFQSPTGRLLVPRRAVSPDNRVAVKGPDGRFRWREIHVEAIMNTDMVVKGLLGEGEVVALDPDAAMGETPSKPAQPPVGVKAP